MLDKIKNLLRHSFIYSISNVSLKASGVILLPIYTSYFSVEDYGKLGLIQITIILISQSLILGQGLSLIRFNNSLEFNSRKSTILFTITIFVILVIISFIILTNVFIQPLSSLFGDPYIYREYLQIAIYIIGLITINNLLLSKLRADENSVLYTLSSILKILVMILVAVYLITSVRLGIESVLYAQLLGELIQFLIIIPNSIRHMELKFEKDIIGTSLKYGIPLILSAMAINLLNGSDRYIIKLLKNYTELGLYELGYKVAGVVNMFVIMPFGLTLLPIAFKIYKTEGDKKYYSKLQTYVVFLLLWAGFSLSIFSKEIIMLFAQNSSYYPAYKVVPLIVLAYVIYGKSLISSLGMYLTGKNHYVAIITIICAGLNIGLNFILIPKYGMVGAAFNTVLSFLILDILSVFASNKYYKIPYEHLKIIKLSTMVILYFLLAEYLNDFGLINRLALKSLAIIMFPFLVLVLGYFDKYEIEAMKGAAKKWSKVATWKALLKK